MALPLAQVRAVDFVMAAVYRALRETFLHQGVRDFNGLPPRNWSATEPWIGERSSFSRPADAVGQRMRVLLDELVRPIVARPLQGSCLIGAEGATPTDTAATKIDEIMVMLGAVSVLCGFNPPHGNVLFELRTKLEHLLAAE